MQTVSYFTASTVCKTVQNCSKVFAAGRGDGHREPRVLGTISFVSLIVHLHDSTLKIEDVGRMFAFFLTIDLRLLGRCAQISATLSSECVYLLNCVYMFVCIFNKLHINAQSGPVILVILCHSH